jgi:hypothetical protein
VYARAVMTSKSKLWAALFAGCAATAAAACGGGGTTATTGATSMSGSGSGGGATTGSGGASTGSSAGSGGGATTSTTGGGGSVASATVFLIVMENHNWADIKGSASAPFINGLLATGAHAEQYKNPPGLHPSEPNYIWLEAGDNLGVSNDLPPSFNHQSTKAHLVTQLEKAGHTWKSYQEDIDGLTCPLDAVKSYAPKHNPMIFFDDITDMNDAMSQHCISHVRPFTELATDLAQNKVANYNFLTPNLCNDMHDTCAPQNDNIKQGDDWLAAQVPVLLGSQAFTDGATVIITWDEGELGDGPIGMIVLGKSVKVGFTSNTPFTHSSTVRTMQDIFGLSPYLGGAAGATSLAEMFTTLP